MIDINQLVRKNVKALKPYSSARDEFEEVADVYLDANENPFENGLNRYPDPHQRQVKRRLSTLKKVAPTNILLGNGSDEVLDLLFRAFCEPKQDNVVCHNPSYGMYPVLAGINQVELRKVSLKSGFQLNADAMMDASDENTKLFLICSPNNPSGNLLAKAEITKLLQLQRGLVVIDEAYIDFAEADSWLAELSKYPNLVVCQTLSKAWGLAGLRVGMCFASTEIINVLNRIKPPYNINELSQQAALKALNQVDEYNRNLQSILKQKERLEKALPCFIFIKNLYPSDANFLLIEVADANGLYDYLVTNKVIIRNRSNEHLCKGCLRITVGLPAENDRLLQYLKAYQQ